MGWRVPTVGPPALIATTHDPAVIRTIPAHLDRSQARQGDYPLARARGVDLAKLGARRMAHAGEPTARIPLVRARIEEAWGAGAGHDAGMTEMGAYGFECAAQADLHVNDSAYIAEVMDPATGAPAPEGAGPDPSRACGFAARAFPDG
jgi:hypothetical protein